MVYQNKLYKICIKKQRMKTDWQQHKKNLVILARGLVVYAHVPLQSQLMCKNV